MTYLHQAVLENRGEIITALFHAGHLADLLPLQVTGDRSNYQNMTAMDIARKLHFTSIVDEIQQCKDIEDSMNWLHRMSREGNLLNVLAILKKHPDLLEQEAHDHTSSIFWAVTSGELAVVKMLVDKGADVFCRSGKGDTLLTRSVSLNQLHLVEYLVQTCGLDPDMSGADGKNPLQIAIENNSLAMVKELVLVGSTPVDTNFLHLARGGNQELIRFILGKFSLDVNYQDRKGKSPLFYAIEHGHIEVVKDLINRKANLRMTDKRERFVNDITQCGISEVTVYFYITL